MVLGLEWVCGEGYVEEEIRKRLMIFGVLGVGCVVLSDTWYICTYLQGLVKTCVISNLFMT
jgi:hypothetical protein